MRSNVFDFWLTFPPGRSSTDWTAVLTSYLNVQVFGRWPAVLTYILPKRPSIWSLTHCPHIHLTWTSKYLNFDPQSSHFTWMFPDPHVHGLFKSVVFNCTWTTYLACEHRSSHLPQYVPPSLHSGTSCACVLPYHHINNGSPIKHYTCHVYYTQRGQLSVRTWNIVLL